MEYDLASLYKNNDSTTPSSLKAKSSSPKNKAKIAEALELFEKAWESSSSWRKNKKIADDFYDGLQLSEEERQALKDRSQPDVVINKIKTQVDLVLGLRERFKRRIKVFNRNESEEDMQTAEAFSEALRYVDQTNLVEFTDSQVFEDGIIGGRGYFYNHVELNDEFEPEIKISYQPPEDIVVDPEAKAYDLSDAKRIWQTLWYDIEDLIAMFPSKERLIRRAQTNFSDAKNSGKSFIEGFQQIMKFKGDQYYSRMYQNEKTRDIFYDEKNSRLRVMNYWYKKRESRTIIYHPDIGIGMIGPDVSKKQIEEASRQIQEMSGMPPEFMEKDMPVVKVCTLIGGEELESKDSPYLHNQFPFVPYTCFRERQRGEPYGIPRQALDPQREINKRRSKALHILNTQRIIAEEGAVDDEEAARQEVLRPDGYIKTNRGFKFEVERNSDLGNAQLEMYQMSLREIQETTGISPDLFGAITNARSGTAIDKRVEQGLAVLSKVFTNWKQTKLGVGKQIVSLIQQYWTEEKAIRVTDDQNITKFLRLNQTVMVGGKPVVLKNVNVGKYDVVFEETDSELNMGSEVFTELAKMAQTGAIPPDIVMEFAPIPYGLRQRILQRLQPQPAQAPVGPDGQPLAAPTEQLGAEIAMPAQGQSPEPLA